MKWKAAFTLALLGTFLAACTSPTPTPAPTATLLPPSITPVPPTETPLPTITATSVPTEKVFLPGWKRFEGKEFEIWLPDTYRGGAGMDNLVAMEQIHRDAGQAELAEFVKSNVSLLLFYGLDVPLTGTDKFFTSLMIFAERPIFHSFVGNTAKDYAYGFDFFYGDPACKVFWNSKSKTVTVPGFEAYRQVIEHNCKDTISIEYLLIEKNGSFETNIWFLIFTCQTSQFEVLLPVFDSSAGTFTLK